MSNKNKNRKNEEKQTKIYLSPAIIEGIKKINDEFNIENNLNRQSGLNRSKVGEACFNLYINNVKFRKMIIDTILKGE